MLNKLRNIGSFVKSHPVAGPVGSLLVTGWQINSAAVGFNERVQEGEKLPSALVKELGFLAIGAALGGIPGLAWNIAIPAAQIAAAQGFEFYKTGSRMHYDFRNPFSQKFEHSDVTSALQVRGLEAMRGSLGHRYMGSEAVAFSKRYSR